MALRCILLLGSASKVLTSWRIGSGEIRTRPPTPCSSSRNIAPATASAHNVKVTAEVRLDRAKLVSAWRSSSIAARAGRVLTAHSARRMDVLNKLRDNQTSYFVTMVAEMVVAGIMETAVCNIPRMFA